MQPPAEQEPGKNEDESTGRRQPTTDVPQLVGVPREWAMQLLQLKQLKGIHGQLYLPKERWQNEWLENRVYLQTPQPATVTRP